MKHNVIYSAVLIGCFCFLSTLATAQVDTLRIKLLKVAAAITRNTRRVRLYLASNWPSADIFVHAVTQLRSP